MVDCERSFGLRIALGVGKHQPKLARRRPVRSDSSGQLRAIGESHQHGLDRWVFRREQVTALGVGIGLRSEARQPDDMLIVDCGREAAASSIEAFKVRLRGNDGNDRLLT